MDEKEGAKLCQLLLKTQMPSRVREDFHQENLDSERIALTLNMRTTIIVREMLENLHTFHRHPYRHEIPMMLMMTECSSTAILDRLITAILLLRRKPDH